MPPKATVVTVHGALVQGWEMGLLRHRLRQAGYHVRQFHYRSMRHGLEENTACLRQFITETPGDTLHVVAHSMGGILTRRIFEQTPDPRPGRLVAIGSPFLNCWVGRKVSRFPLLGSALTGRTVRDYLTTPLDPQWRGTRQLGVLAGTFPLGVGSFLAGLPRPHDGVIRWEETRLNGITDHVTFPINHFGMLLSRACADQIGHFLEHGKFTVLGSDPAN